MFLPLIVKWVVGEHLLLKIENGLGEDEREVNRGSEACRLLRESKSTGDDFGLRSPFFTDGKEKGTKNAPFQSKKRWK
jgi:hypothetical protein